MTPIVAANVNTTLTGAPGRDGADVGRVLNGGDGFGFAWVLFRYVL